MIHNNSIRVKVLSIIVDKVQGRLGIRLQDHIFISRIPSQDEVFNLGVNLSNGEIPIEQ